MPVESVPSIPQSALTAPGNASGPRNSLADMNAFLLLFTTQLQHQDPTKPMDPHEMSAQLAQFTTVEKLAEIHNVMQTQLMYLASINNAQGIEFLGKTVTVFDNRILLTDGRPSHAALELSAPAEVTVTIRDKAGNTVRTLNLGPLEKGRHAIEWDGKDDSGNSVPDGTYTFQVEAVGSDGNPVDVRTLIVEKVYGFRVDAGVSYLIIGDSDGLEVPIGSVLSIEENNSPETGSEHGTSAVDDGSESGESQA